MAGMTLTRRKVIEAGATVPLVVALPAIAAPSTDVATRFEMAEDLTMTVTMERAWKDKKTLKFIKVYDNFGALDLPNIARMLLEHASELGELAGSEENIRIAELAAGGPEVRSQEELLQAIGVASLNVARRLWDWRERARDPTSPEETAVCNATYEKFANAVEEHDRLVQDALAGTCYANDDKSRYRVFKDAFPFGRSAEHVRRRPRDGERWQS